MSFHGNSHYDMLVQAAEMVNKELGFFTDDSVEENDDYINDVEREIWFLNCSLEYYYSMGIYPFGTTRSARDFSDNWVKMGLVDFIEENQRMRKMYKKRVRKVCKKGQLLEPREQEAFDIGNKIWGTRSGDKRDQHHRHDHVLLGETSHNEDPEEVLPHDPKEEDDPLARFPLLKETFKFGINISDELKIPVTIVKDWNDGWRKIQVQELKIFLDKLTLLKQQTMYLLDEIDQ